MFLLNLVKYIDDFKKLQIILYSISLYQAADEN